MPNRESFKSNLASWGKQVGFKFSAKSLLLLGDLIDSRILLQAKPLVNRFSAVREILEGFRPSGVCMIDYNRSKAIELKMSSNARRMGVSELRAALI